MINKIFLLGIFALLLLTVPARSADWLNYLEDKDGEMVYIDMDSISRTSSNTIRIFKKVEPAGSSGISSVVSEIEMDCGKGLIRYLKETTYLSNGESSTASKNETFRKVTPEDVDESLMELVCSLKKSK